MKHKKLNPQQWTLEQCVTFIIKGIDDATARDLVACGAEPAKWLGEFGRWIRNNCGLWEHGTDRCVDDIVAEYKAGRLKSKLLDGNQLTHPDIPFNLENTRALPALIDCSLYHPDNCSGVIIEYVIQRLQDGNR